jgi:hypothetical protein
MTRCRSSFEREGTVRKVSCDARHRPFFSPPHPGIPKQESILSCIKDDILQVFSNTRFVMSDSKVVSFMTDTSFRQLVFHEALFC